MRRFQVHVVMNPCVENATRYHSGGEESCSPFHQDKVDPEDQRNDEQTRNGRHEYALDLLPVRVFINNVNTCCEEFDLHNHPHVVRLTFVWCIFSMANKNINP